LGLLPPAGDARLPPPRRDRAAQRRFTGRARWSAFPPPAPRGLHPHRPAHVAPGGPGRNALLSPLPRAREGLLLEGAPRREGGRLPEEPSRSRPARLPPRRKDLGDARPAPRRRL